MKIFLDTGDIEAIRKANATGLVSGVTTNPTHLRNTGKPFRETAKEICREISGTVSVEAVGETAEDLISHAQEIAEFAPNIVVKIPMTVEGLKAVPVLSKEMDIKTNVTMIFSSTQAFLAMKAGATYASIVLSRLDAVANESSILTNDAMTIKKNYRFSTEVLAASLKTQNHLLDCLRAGVDIVTLPVSLFFQMFQHPLTDSGLAQFAKDWQEVPK